MTGSRPSRPRDRADLLARLEQLRPWLTSHGVERLRLFGSYARDEACETSDIDLIVQFDRPVGLAMLALQDDLSEHLGARVELVTEPALAPDIRLTALRDALDA